jgi:hypothetical protein
MRFRPLAAVLLSLPLALPALAAPSRSGGASRHPDVAAARAVQDCDECHRTSTPAVVAEWEAGAHGVGMVKCLVCHGSTGADFNPGARSDRCAGCHASEVASVTPAHGKPAVCFSCHAPHALTAPGKLSPHGR